MVPTSQKRTFVVIGLSTLTNLTNESSIHEMTTTVINCCRFICWSVYYFSMTSVASLLTCLLVYCYSVTAVASLLTCAIWEFDLCDIDNITQVNLKALGSWLIWDFSTYGCHGNGVYFLLYPGLACLTLLLACICEIFFCGCHDNGVSITIYLFIYLYIQTDARWDWCPDYLPHLPARQ